MRISFTKTWLLASVAVAGMLSVAGCTEDKYDFNEIDSTIGIGGGTLTLPGSSTDTIQLSDVLDIDDSECVETRANGDYVFKQDGDEVDPANPKIDVVHLADKGSDSERLDITGIPTVSGAAGTTVTLPEAVHVSGSIRVLNYEGEKPDGLKKLNSADAADNFTLTVVFSQGMKNYVPKLKKLTIRFPEYMEMEGLKVDGRSVSNLVLNDVSTASDIMIEGRIVGFDFTNSNALEEFTENDKQMLKLTGNVSVDLEIAEVKIGSQSPSDLHIESDMTIGDFVITEATGLFDPDIDLDDLGDVTITDVPDFLDDGEVVMDIYNPQIVLTITNDMDVEGLLSGDLMPYKDGVALLTRPVTIPDTRIHANGTTEVYICRDVTALGSVGTPGAMVEKTQVSDLSKLIETIPDRITFDANVRANSDKEGSFKLGHTYTVNTSYNIEAPLAFAEKAKIVYNDTINEWQEDIEDIELKEGSYLELKGEIVNCIPLYLNIKATPIDVDGNPCPEAKVEVIKGEAVASGDGVKAETSELEIRISGDISKLDGLVLRIEASASDPANVGAPVEGVTLNEKDHYIIVRDIEISLQGTVIVDMN